MWFTPPFLELRQRRGHFLPTKPGAQLPRDILQKKMLRAAPVPPLPGKEHHKLPQLSSAQQEFGLCCRDSYGRANKASSFHLGRARLLSRCPPFGIYTERSVAGTDAAGALALLGAADPLAQCLGLDRAGRAQALWVLHPGGLILGKKGENAPKRSSTREGVCHKWGSHGAEPQRSTPWEKHYIEKFIPN